MAQIIQKLRSLPKYQRVTDWVKLLSLTGLSQLIIQAATLVTGIIIIRLLPTNQYAFYTLANTTLGTLTVLADGGISSGIMANGGRVWQDKTALGSVIVTGMSLRRKFALLSLTIMVPALAYLLWRQGAPWLTIVAVTASLILGFWAALSDSLFEIAPKLHQDIKPLQKNQMLVGLIRLVISPLFLLLAPFAWMALLANGLPRIYGNIKLRSIATKFADFTQPASLPVKRDILKIVRRVLPGSIYYCLSGQIAVWLISIFGNNLSVAHIGALGRLAMILSLCTTVFNTLIIPRFARADNKSLKKNFFLILVLLLVTGVILFILSLLFATLFLELLGSGYAGLETELVLCFMSSYITIAGGSLYHIALTKGWVFNPVILIIVNVVMMIVGILIFDISSLRGVIYFQLFTSIVPAVLSTVFCGYKAVRASERSVV